MQSIVIGYDTQSKTDSHVTLLVGKNTGKMIRSSLEEMFDMSQFRALQSENCPKSFWIIKFCWNTATFTGLHLSMAAFSLQG